MPRGFPNKKPSGLLYAAKQAFTTLLDGVPVTVFKGQTAREGHPIIRGRESMFEPLRVDFEHEDAPESTDDAPAVPIAPTNPGPGLKPAA